MARDDVLILHLKGKTADPVFPLHEKDGYCSGEDRKVFGCIAELGLLANLPRAGLEHPFRKRILRNGEERLALARRPSH